MPGGPDLVTFHNDYWDHPEPIVPLVIAGQRKERPAKVKTHTPEQPKTDSGSEGTLQERWHATHGMDPPAWADNGFAGIKEHMKQQAEAAEGTGMDTVTIYSLPSDWTPQQQIRAFWDPQLPGVQAPADQSWKYEDEQAIPDHTLPRFRGNPKNNFQVMMPVPEYLRGYWTNEHQSPHWEGDGKGDIRTQEGRLQEIIKGYAALAARCMTTYEYKAPGGLNHGLSIFHDEIDKCMVPPMVKYASALLGDFMALYQEREFHRRRLAQLEQQALETHDHTDTETNILRAQLPGAHQEVEWGHQLRERLKDQLKEINSQEQKAQQDLQTSRERAAKLAGEMALLWKHVGDLEDEVTRIRKAIRSHARAESATSGKAEAASSKTLTSSIAQMTIGTAPPVMTTPTTRQAAANHATTTTAAARSQPSTQAGSTNVTVTAAQSAVQMATGSLSQHLCPHWVSLTFPPGTHLTGECTPTRISSMYHCRNLFLL